ncbi:MAG: hypothetical protein U0271_42680 [Polyangiaceae bacterium]
MTEDPERETGEDQDESDEEETPAVVLARLRDLGDAVPAELRKVYGNRPVWYLLSMDAELVTIFEQLPEDPMPKGKVTAIMAAIRAFAEAHNDELQSVLGVTDSLEVGFHVDAQLDRVREAFEEDGFLVVGEIVNGVVRELEDEEGEGTEGTEKGS